MSLGIFAKLLSDCCLFYAILTAFPTAFPVTGALLLPTLGCAAAGALAAYFSERGRSTLMRLCALVPFAMLLPAGDTLLLLPAVLYTAVVILRGELWLEYYAYRENFLRSLKLLGVLLIAVLFLSIVSDPNGVREELLILVNNTICYGLLHLVLGVLLQRRLRLGLETQTCGELSQTIALLGGVAAASVGFGAVVLVTQSRIAELARAAVATVLSPVFALLGAVTRAAEELERSPEYQQAVIEGEQQATGGADLTSVGDAVTVPADATLMQQESQWWLPLVIAAVVLAMLLLLLAFRRQKHRDAPVVLSGDAAGEPRKRHNPRFSTRARIRHAYRDYLRQEKKRGVVIEKNCTSEDILRRLSVGSDREAAAQLRALYLQARYDDAHEPERAQGDAALAAGKKIHRRA